MIGKKKVRKILDATTPSAPPIRRRDFAPDIVPSDERASINYPMTQPSYPAAGPSAKLLWSLLLPAMLVPVLGAYLYFVLWHGTVAAAVLYQATKIFTVLFPIICSVWILRTGLPFRRSPGSHHLRAIPAGLGLGLAIVAVAFIVLETPIGTAARASGDQIRQHLSGTPWLEYFWPIAIAISIIHSFVEEFFWRFFVYGQLLKNVLPRPAALAVGGIAFSLHHIVVLLQFFPVGIALFFSACVGVGGVLWSLLMDHQKSLSGAWASHMVVDFGVLTIGYWLMFP